ncbi:MAG: hypothetical protein J3K34DRAFT_463652 [Monoraphidium minutum]|nr:MAG: hypothetical protein J3K34DRAFT_463652 [Monoraphidium minutum]
MAPAALVMALLLLDRRYDLWVHLHGVSWVGWWRGPPVNHAILAAEAVPYVQRFVGNARVPGASSAIQVYPNALGDPAKGQVWGTPFWACFRETCQASADDAAFIDALFARLAQQLPVDARRQFLSGHSNGAMLVGTILCANPGLAGRLRGAAMVAGALGKAWAGRQCGAPTRLPLLVVAGSDDPHMNYEGESVNAGVTLLTGAPLARGIAAKFACKPGASPPVVFSGPAVSCSDLCSGGGGTGAQPLLLCSVAGGTHDWNARPGEMEKAELLGKFFKSLK